MDTIHIRNLVFAGKHGVYAEERKVEQEFQIDLTLSTDMDNACKTDNLADTIDYQEIKESVQRIIEGTSSYLIEKIAQNIADTILKHHKIQTVTVVVQKIAVWKNGIPGVTVTRTKTI